MLVVSAGKDSGGLRNGRMDSCLWLLLERIPVDLGSEKAHEKMVLSCGGR